MSENVDTAVSDSQLSLINDVVDQVQQILEEAEKTVRPLEMEPYRGRLFELFVLADGAGLVDDELDHGLASDHITKMLADRWDLRDAAMKIAKQAGVGGSSAARMRLLWSFLRMWMEWSYAWQRWAEFHNGGNHPASSNSGEKP